MNKKDSQKTEEALIQATQELHLLVDEALGNAEFAISRLARILPVLEKLTEEIHEFTQRTAGLHHEPATIDAK